MRRDKTREQAGKIRERTGSEKMRPPPLSAKEEEIFATIFVLISATYNILMTNMYLFLYSAQTLLQYYVTKMGVHVCIFLEKKYYAWLVSFGGKNVAEIRP